MLIISKFHDFYDHVSKAGVDKHVVLQRKQELVDIPSGLKFRPMDLAHVASVRNERGRFLEGRVYVLDWVYFCGKAYPGIRSYFLKGEEKSDFQQHTKEDLESKIPLNSRYYKSDWRSGLTPQQELSQALQGKNEIPAEVFQNLKVPYFGFNEIVDTSGRWIHRKNKLLVYPNLKDYTSFLKMDAYTVYQEIEMYCSGVLGVGEPETIEVSDISKRDSKGFDEFSFKHRK